MLQDDLYGEISKLPAIDVHSHLPRNQMAAASLGGVMFYHMLIYPLRAAGAPEEKLWPEHKLHQECAAEELSFDSWLAHWPAIANTGFAWVLGTILRDLYGFDEPVTSQSLPRLREVFAAKTSQPDWARQVFAKGNIVRVLSSQTRVPPLEAGQYDGGIRFTMETSPSVGFYEHVPWPKRLERWCNWSKKEITTLAQMDNAAQEFFDKTDWTGKDVLVNWISSEADFRPVADSVIDSALADCRRGVEPPPDTARLLEAASVRSILRAVHGRIKTYQLIYGTQFLTAGPALHPVAKAAPSFASTLAYLIGEFNDVHFNLLSGYEPDEPILCALCLGYNNVSLGSFWWQTFYPSVMHAAWHRRLDMVPVNRLCGFFSDGYCVDYIYGRLRMTQRVLANVLAEKIERGFCTRGQAVQIARDLLFETPRQLFLPNETF